MAPEGRASMRRSIFIVSSSEGHVRLRALLPGSSRKTSHVKGVSVESHHWAPMCLTSTHVQWDCLVHIGLVMPPIKVGVLYGH